MNFFKKAQLEITGMAKDGDTYVFKSSKSLRRHWPSVVRKNRDTATDEAPVKARIDYELGPNPFHPSGGSDLNGMDFKIPTALEVVRGSGVYCNNTKNLKSLTVGKARNVYAKNTELEKIKTGECSKLDITNSNMINDLDTKAYQLVLFDVNVDDMDRLETTKETQVFAKPDQQTKISALKNTI